MNASLQPIPLTQATVHTINLPTAPASQPTTSTELRVLRIKDVAKKLSIGKSTIYDWLNLKSPRYDATFPKPFKLGGKAIGWLSSEVDAWLLKRVALTRVTDLSEMEIQSNTH